MTEREPLNLEELFERLGSKEIPGDSRHRYALRRALLKSRCFEVNQLTAKWLKAFSITSSAVAGGAVAVAFVMAVQATLSMEVANYEYAADDKRISLQAANSITTTDLAPMEYLNQMQVADFSELLQEQKLRQVLDQNIDLAFTR